MSETGSGIGDATSSTELGADDAHKINVSPARRAAVILAVLGKDIAAPIVDKLDDNDLAKVAKELREVSVMPRTQIVAIISAFLMEMNRLNGALRGGAGRARELISELVDPKRVDSVLGQSDTDKRANSSEDSIWSKIEDRPSQQLADYLTSLNPKLISMVLRQLSVDKASEVAKHMHVEKLRNTMGYMVKGEPIDLSVLQVLEETLRAQFIDSSNETDDDEDEAYLEAIGEILSLIPNEKRESLVSFLRDQFESKLSRIEQGLFTIENIPDLLPRNIVPVVFRELSNAKMVPILAALQGDDSPVVDYLLGCISSRMAEQIRIEMQDIGPRTTEDVEKAQYDFLTALMALKRDGLISAEKSAA